MHSIISFCWQANGTMKVTAQELGSVHSLVQQDRVETSHKHGRPQNHVLPPLIGGLMENADRCACLLHQLLPILTPRRLQEKPNTTGTQDPNKEQLFFWCGLRFGHNATLQTFFCTLFNTGSGFFYATFHLFRNHIRISVSFILHWLSAYPRYIEDQL